MSTSDTVSSPPTPAALDGVRVVELATVIAGPGVGKYLADFGADVIKIEAPGGDPTRRMGWKPADGGDSYMWKLINRNKRCVELDLRSEVGKAALGQLLAGADVLIENMRPGKLEALGFDPATLAERNPPLVTVRLTGFGQTGPYAQRAGFATIAEAMSGFCDLLGEPDGAPLLPPIALTDELTALVGAFATVTALRHAERTGTGQVIDVNLLDSMFQIMGPLVSAFAHLGYLQPRLGAGIPYSVPRGTYRCGDGTWVAISTSAEKVAASVIRLIGLDHDPRLASFQGRSEHRHEVEAAMAAWVSQRSAPEVLAAFEEIDAAIGPVLDMRGIFDDPHIAARGSIAEVDGVTMQGVIARLSATPGALHHAGRPLGADTRSVLDRLAEPDGAWLAPRNRGSS